MSAQPTQLILETWKAKTRTKGCFWHPQVKRLSTAAVRTETALTEAKSKVDGLTRQLQCVQQRIEASDGLERDLKRLGQDAEEMHEKHNRLLADKQVQRRLHPFTKQCYILGCCLWYDPFCETRLVAVNSFWQVLPEYFGGIW